MIELEYIPFDKEPLLIIKNNTMSNFFNLNWKDILSAVVLSVIVAILGYIVSVTDIVLLSLHQIINIAVLTGAGSLLKALTTTNEGKFLGVLKIK